MGLMLGKFLSDPNRNPSATTWGSWAFPDPGWERESEPRDPTFFTMGEVQVDISLSLRSLSSGGRRKGRGTMYEPLRMGWEQPALTSRPH